MKDARGIAVNQWWTHVDGGHYQVTKFVKMRVRDWRHPNAPWEWLEAIAYVKIGQPEVFVRETEDFLSRFKPYVALKPPPVMLGDYMDIRTCIPEEQESGDGEVLNACFGEQLRRYQNGSTW